MTRKEKDRAVELIVHYLGLHGLIADSGEAERGTAKYVRVALLEAEYDAKHGRGASYRKYLNAVTKEVRRERAATRLHY